MKVQLRHYYSFCAIAVMYRWDSLEVRCYVVLQIVAATRAKGDRSNGINIAFNYIIPIGILVAGILFTKW